MVFLVEIIAINNVSTSSVWLPEMPCMGPNGIISNNPRQHKISSQCIIKCSNENSKLFIENKVQMIFQYIFFLMDLFKQDGEGNGGRNENPFKELMV